MRKSGFIFLITMLLTVLVACSERINAPVTEDPLAPAVTATTTPTIAPTAEPDNTTPTASPVITSTVTPTPVISPTAAVIFITATPTPALNWTEGEVYFTERTHFLTGETQLEIKTESAKAGYITYTLDGTEPTETSALYEGPIRLASGTAENPKCHTFRAKAWYEDGTSSDSYVQTYFVADSVTERFSTYVLAVNGDPSELTEGPDGILYEENALNRGRDYERKVHLELISAEGETVFAQFAGLRAYGGDSRTFPIKPFKVYARKEYEKGKGTFALSAFGTPTLDGTGIVEKYDKLVLRNGGDDFQQSGLREELMHRMARDAGFDAYEEVIPTVVYMNGKYYGFFWMHESYCDKYFQYRNGKSKGEYVVLEGSDVWTYGGKDSIEIAAENEYNQIYGKYSTADLTQDAVFEELNRLVDVNNYLDYMSYNIYIANFDWPNSNFRCFRYYAEDGVYGTGEMDGRWRYLIHDMDSAFSTYNAGSKTANAGQENLKEVIADPEHQNYSPLLAALLKREDCRQYFLDRMTFYMEEAVTYDRVKSLVDELRAECDAEMPYYYDYLQEVRKTNPVIWTYIEHREKSINTILLFAQLRPEYMKQQLNELLGYLY